MNLKKFYACVVLLLSLTVVSAFGRSRKDTITNNKIYTAVQQNPTFPGGEQAFGHFLSINIKYPSDAKRNNVQGRAFVQFVVEKNGSLSDLKILRDPGSGLGDEAMRVLALSPKWNPGKQNGENVRVQYIVPINFHLGGSTPNPILHSLASDTGKKVFNAVEIQPAFPGGESAFGLFLKNNIHYPDLARKNNIQGRVFISFIVERDGRLSGMQILRDPGTGLGEEAMRVLSLSPPWTPGIQNGKPVRVQYTVPINFSLGK